MFLASLLRGVAARLFPWSGGSPQKTPTAADVVAPAAPKRRPVQRRPMLWSVRSQKLPPHRVFCGPTATSALIGADVDEIMHLIQTHRGNDHPVEGTSPDELQHVLRQFGALAADTSPPIPRVYFFGNPQRYFSNISPDAQWLSWLAPVSGVMNLWVAPLDHPDDGWPVTHDSVGDCIAVDRA